MNPLFKVVGIQMQRCEGKGYSAMALTVTNTIVMNEARLARRERDWYSEQVLNAERSFRTSRSSDKCEIGLGVLASFVPYIFSWVAAMYKLQYPTPTLSYPSSRHLRIGRLRCTFHHVSKVDVDNPPDFGVFGCNSFHDLASAAAYIHERLSFQNGPVVPLTVKR